MEPVTTAILAGAAMGAGSKFINEIFSRLFGGGKQKYPAQPTKLQDTGLNIDQRFFQQPQPAQPPVMMPVINPTEGMSPGEIQEYNEEFDLLKMSNLDPAKRRALARLLG